MHSEKEISRFTVSKCLNCATILSGGYCQICVQSVLVNQVTFKETIDGFLSSTFSPEGNLLNSAIAMVKISGQFHRKLLQSNTFINWFKYLLISFLSIHFYALYGFVFSILIVFLKQ